MMIHKRTKGISCSKGTMLFWSVVLLVIFQGCENCGPGAITSNPYISNLIDYTDPPSGIILQNPAFSSFEVYFSTPIDRNTLSLLEDVQVFRIENFWDVEDEDQWITQELVSDDFFTGQPEWSCENHRVCDPLDSDHRPEYADKLVLQVNQALIVVNNHYKIQILGICPEDEEPVDCSDNPVTSWDGYGLDPSQNIFIGIMPEGARDENLEPWISPFMFRVLPQSLEHQSNPRIQPHTRLEFWFSHQMGFVNMQPDPLSGFYVKNETVSVPQIDWTFTKLISDSKQGFLPGTTYVLDFYSRDPDDGNMPLATKGIPFTMDRWGNPLTGSLLDSTETPVVPKDKRYEFHTSHVRILFPIHKPFSEEADDWNEQLKDSDVGRPFIIVEVTKDVALVKSPDFDPGQTWGPDVTFPPLDDFEPGREHNSIHWIWVDEVFGANKDGIADLTVEAYGFNGEYLGSDSLSVYSPPPRKINIVSYNTFSHNAHRGLGWQERIEAFVLDIVVPYRPAIISLQEVYLRSHDCENCDLCTPMGRGYFLSFFLQTIMNNTRSDYRIASATCSNWAKLCAFPIAEEWEGDAIIYNPGQVKYIQTIPLGNDNLSKGCEEWSEGQEQWYEHPPGEYNDCFLKNNTNYGFPRAIFEFPIGSGHYLSFHGFHGYECHIPEAVEFIRERQYTLREDLEVYLASDPSASPPFWIYPPIFAGDMNTHRIEDCDDPDAIWWYINRYFIDAPSPRTDFMDKVWVGQEYHWDTDAPLYIVNPVPGESRWPFSNYDYGYLVVGENKIYTDHSPAMVEIESIVDW